MSKKEKIYYENFKDAVERNRKKLPSLYKKLKDAGVKYILSSWIDLHGWCRYPADVRQWRAPRG